jgi:hypothetical protein
LDLLQQSGEQLISRYPALEQNDSFLGPIHPGSASMTPFRTNNAPASIIIPFYVPVYSVDEIIRFC